MAGRGELMAERAVVVIMLLAIVVAVVWFLSEE